MSQEQCDKRDSLYSDPLWVAGCLENRFRTDTTIEPPSATEKVEIAAAKLLREFASARSHARLMPDQSIGNPGTLPREAYAPSTTPPKDHFPYAENMVNAPRTLDKYKSTQPNSAPHNQALAWIATNGSGKVLHLSAADGWSVEVVQEQPNPAPQETVLIGDSGLTGSGPAAAGPTTRTDAIYEDHGGRRFKREPAYYLLIEHARNIERELSAERERADMNYEHCKLAERELADLQKAFDAQAKTCDLYYEQWGLATSAPSNELDSDDRFLMLHSDGTSTPSATRDSIIEECASAVIDARVLWDADLQTFPERMEDALRQTAAQVRALKNRSDGGGQKP